MLAVEFDPGVAVAGFDDLVGDELLVLLDHRIFVAAADQALDGEEGVLGIGDGLSLGGKPDDDLAVIGEGDHRGRGAHAFGILDDLGILSLHHRDAGIGSAEIDTDHFRHYRPLFLADRPGPMSGTRHCSARRDVGPHIRRARRLIRRGSAVI